MELIRQLAFPAVAYVVILEGWEEPLEPLRTVSPIAVGTLLLHLDNSQ